MIYNWVFTNNFKYFIFLIMKIEVVLFIILVIEMVKNFVFCLLNVIKSFFLCMVLGMCLVYIEKGGN